jgi:hypothetical protein
MTRAALAYLSISASQRPADARSQPRRRHLNPFSRYPAVRPKPRLGVKNWTPQNAPGLTPKTHANPPGITPVAEDAVVGCSVAAERGVLDGANFAQKTFKATFSAEGKFAGRGVGDVAADLRAGRLTANQVPLEYIVRDGNTLILNTRSAQALEQAGIPRSQWNAVNVTGNAQAEARLTGQLARNRLTSQGTPTVRPSNGN